MIGLTLLLASGAQSSADAIALTMPAWIAAGAAIAAAVVTAVFQSRMNSRQQKHEKTVSEAQKAHEMKLEKITQEFSMHQREIDWRSRQLNQLYGPLRILRATSKLLREGLPQVEPDGSYYAMVAHIVEIKHDDALGPIGKAILDINAEIESLLIEKAGLMEGTDLPRSGVAITERRVVDTRFKGPHRIPPGQPEQGINVDGGGVQS